MPVYWIDDARFERIVARALRSLPEPFRSRLDNVAVTVEEEPTPEDLAWAGAEPDTTLFGLYVGVPLTQRTSGYGMVLPDRIVIYRGPLLDACQTEQELVREIRQTVAHEIAHHFGLSDADLRAIPRRPRRRIRRADG
ncbi:MAG: metallopeptidase family protein [Chloroflexi bacterium]|nr:metallopeptidase family protein [Chloroflexota bacterium]